MIEIWKKIKGIDENYEISNTGKLKRLPYIILQKSQGGGEHLQPIPERISYGHENNSGYLCHSLKVNGKQKSFLIHRLVAEAFIPNLDNKPQIDHIDTNKKNNCVSNLRWVTAEENSNNPLSKYNNSRRQKCRNHY